MKKITAIIIAFLVIGFIVLSTAGERVTINGKNVETFEFKTVKEDVYIPIEEWTHKNGCYSYYADDLSLIVSINDCLIDDDVEIIHLTSQK